MRTMLCDEGSERIFHKAAALFYPTSVGAIRIHLKRLIL
jgi:hypothetical protein